MDFNEVIDRHGTYCTQWDYAADRFGSSDVIPFSISDADFSVPDEILTAIKSRTWLYALESRWVQAAHRGVV